MLISITRSWVVVASLLVLGCSVSAKRSKEVDRADQGVSLNDKVQQLLELSQRRIVVKLSSKLFRELVRAQPKNYSVVVMFTALQSHRGCSICKQASEEFKLLANSYRYSHGRL